MQQLVLLLALLTFSAGDRGKPRVSNPVTVEQVAAGLTQFARRVLETDSFLVESEIVSSEDFERSKYGKHADGFHMRVARRGGTWYTWLERSQLPLHNQYDRTWVFRDGVAAALFGQNLIIGREPDGYMYFWWLYTTNLFLNIYQYLPESARNHKAQEFKIPFLPESLERDAARYRITSQTEDIDGASCILVERAGVDRIWVDPSLGFVVRKRELFFGPDFPAQTLDRITYNRDFVEAKPGLWLPKTQVIDYFPNPKYEKQEIWGKLTCRTTMISSRIEFDRLGDDFFAIEVPKGTNVNDLVRGKLYVAEDEADEPFAGAIHFAKHRDSATKHAATQKTPVIVMLNLAALAILSGYFLYRRRMRNRSRLTTSAAESGHD